jgi:hypothetical protein
MALAKAELHWQTWIPPVSGVIKCQFNPASLTISKSLGWKGEPSPSFNSPYLKFSGGESATYDLSLLFDSYSDDPPKDVRVYTNQLLALSLRGAGYSMFLVPYASPPTVKLVWGKMTLFSAVLEEVDISFTLFDPDGTPIRAKADVKFKQNELLGDDIIPAQNPTSRTDARKTRIVNSTERLDQIAFEEYGNSAYWRVLAEANGFDNPFTLSDGQIIVIPQNI